MTRWYRQPDVDLVKLVQAECVSRGDFTLASGKKSSFYVDLRKATMKSAGARLVGAVLADTVSDWATVNNQGRGLAPYIGGVADGGIALVTAALAASYHGGQGSPLRGFWVRKESKDHGTQKLVEGYLPEKHEPCVLVEDVVTTGASVLRALDVLRKLGVRVDLVVSVLHRGECENPFDKCGCQYVALTTLKDLGLEAEDAGRDAGQAL